MATKRAPPQPPPIIFLDIDGVLNRTKHATHIRLDDDLVELLKKLVDRTGASIVLTTFWRHFREYIAYVLDRHGIPASLIIGSTPGRGHLKINNSENVEDVNADDVMLGRTAEDEAEYTCRAEEIRAWLAANPGHDRYVILDDRPSAAAEDDEAQSGRFVLCVTSQGLTEDDVEKATAILT